MLLVVLNDKEGVGYEVDTTPDQLGPDVVKGEVVGAPLLAERLEEDVAADVGLGELAIGSVRLSRGSLSVAAGWPPCRTVSRNR